MVDHDLLEHAQKIALIVVLAAIWIVFRVHAIAPDAQAALPPASSPIPSVTGEPLAPSLVDEPKSGMEIGHRFLTLPVKGIRPADLFDWNGVLDRFFDDTPVLHAGAPAVDVRETEKDYRMEMEVPGLTEKDITVEVN